jgi:Cys-tRNA(Pro)/Cys-tRNA(Cys) deacylase
MKKKFPTYFDATAADHEKITVSAGIRGEQMLVDREALIRFVDGTLIDVAK